MRSRKASAWGVARTTYAGGVAVAVAVAVAVDKEEEKEKFSSCGGGEGGKAAAMMQKGQWRRGSVAVVTDADEDDILALLGVQMDGWVG